MRDLDEITEAIIDAAIQIHRDLGPGLLESVYETLLARALEKRGLHVERQTVVRFEYDGMVFDEGFRTDLLVEDQVVVELKSVERSSLRVPAAPRESTGLSTLHSSPYERRCSNRVPFTRFSSKSPTQTREDPKQI